MNDQIVRIEVDALIKGLRIYEKQLARRIAIGVRSTTRKGQEAAWGQAQRRLNIRSKNYIKSGIKNAPETPRQLTASQKAYTVHGDLQGSVYIRGANTPERRLDFLVDHEEGETRRPKKSNKHIMVPSRELSRMSYRTPKGRVKKRYKPSSLLKNQKAFFIKTNRLLLLAARTGAKKKLRIYYFTARTANIKQRWGVVPRVQRSFKRNLSRSLTREIIKLQKSYGF